MPIEMTKEGTYKLTARGNHFTLVREKGEWALYTVNAAVRAYNNGFAIPKYFDSLEAVEKQYKSWSGIAALHQSLTECH